MKTFKMILKAFVGLVLLIALVYVGIYLSHFYLFPKSPRSTAIFESDHLKVKVTYYRPYKKERLIFGPEEENALVPYGKYWRLGANFTTKIKFNRMVSFANQTLEKGTYGLYVYPYEGCWTVYVHEKRSGISYNEPEQDGIITQFDRPTTTLDEPLEQFTIDFQEIEDTLQLRFAWDTILVHVPIEIEKFTK
ncbi:MAG: DUF2911 domain-containing protein [Flavobacteriaceae bacterium]|nr:DUF2911 domain-containing protein [Flavobacteriaceae bacterium]